MALVESTQREDQFSVHPETAENIIKTLSNEVDDWHGLHLEKFGALQTHSAMAVSKDRKSWQQAHCYLFERMVLIMNDDALLQKDAAQDAVGLNMKPSLRGSILLPDHLVDVESSTDELVLRLNLTTAEFPVLYLKFRDRSKLKQLEGFLSKHVSG